MNCIFSSDHHCHDEHVCHVTVGVTRHRVVDSQGEVHERVHVLLLYNHVPAEVSQQCQNQ